MRFLYALTVLLTVLLLPNFALADGPSNYRYQNEGFGRESRIERRLRAVDDANLRLRRENDYLRSLRRDYRQFRGSSSRRVSRRYAEPAPGRVSREERLAQRCLEAPARATVQDSVRAILIRLRDG